MKKFIAMLVMGGALLAGTGCSGEKDKDKDKDKKDKDKKATSVLVIKHLA